eukprot:CAMPEP_0197941788 /NCGR_PEP_ID=MMETSP1439-20131203/123331_1 /TAXON_ID=66791 /ORGANISM="Gonyaulax spinifera, Strain CCMP409" /LENGTH=152 /DNA_ID=CAMNT_0043565001 /DNA_START=8 /DNA_END=466 /DNA_ORIENTATION=+
MVSWAIASLIFVIPPSENPLLHSCSFIQLMVFMYLAFLANFFEAPPKRYPHLATLYLVVYAVATFGFAFMAVFQLLSYNKETGERGPIPWYCVAACDYTWFTCIGIGSYFRPPAPSIEFNYVLVSDDDFRVDKDMQKPSTKGFTPMKAEEAV